MFATTIKTTILGLTVVAGAALFNPANATTKRTPIDAQNIRETTAEVSSYENEVKIVRTRSSGKTYASFYADPQLIDHNSVAYFEIKSYAETGVLSRWRCIATHDVAECLGKPVKIRYLPEDTKIELSFKLVPRLDLRERLAYAKR